MAATADTAVRPEELAALGLEPSQVAGLTCIHEKHGSALYRLACEQRSFVLKRFAGPGPAVEVLAYALLREHGVPTLGVHGSTDLLLLLEDLAASPEWRLAEAPDAESEETGRSVAEWYRAFHAAGAKIVARPAGPPGFLGRETDALSPGALAAAGRRLGVSDAPAWRLAVECIEALTAAMRTLPETLNYNDFHWTNLALSRRTEPLRAIVFDYHLLGIGPRCCDVRNVAGSLGSRARAAFLDAYGPADEREALLDAPLAPLYSLWVAARQPRLPAWAAGSLAGVRDGTLERDLRRALRAL